MLRYRRVFVLVVGLALVAAACGGDDADSGTDSTVATTAAPSEPAEPFAPAAAECIAPSDPGGGWDFTCRTIGLLMEDLAGTGNVITTNQPIRRYVGHQARQGPEVRHRQDYRTFQNRHQ